MSRPGRASVAAAGRRDADDGTPWVRAAWLLFLLALAFHFFGALSRILLLAYAAAILAIALDSIVRRLPLHRRWVAALAGLLILAAVGAAVWFGGAALIGQVRQFAQQLPEMQARLHQWGEWLHQRLGVDVQLVGDRTQRMVHDMVGDIGGQEVLSRAYGVIEVMGLTAVVLFGSLFALAEPNRRLLTPFLRMLPERTRDATRRCSNLLTQRLRGWVKGQLISMATIGILATAAFWIIGVPFAPLLGVVNGLAEFVPIAGPWIGGVPAVLVAFLYDPAKALWTALAIIVIQQVESQLVTPMVMSKVAEVHPFVTLFSILLFGSVFGVLGVLLALPLVLLAGTVIQVFWIERGLGSAGEEIDPLVETEDG